MDQVLLIFPFVAFIASIIWKPEEVLCSLGILILFFIHSNLMISLPLFPDIHVFQLTLIPILGVAVVTRWYKWKFSLVDLLLVFYLFFVTYAQYVSQFSYNTRNVFGFYFLQILVTYGTFKLLLQEGKYSIKFAQRFIYFTVFVIILGFYEMRMSSNLFVKFASFFDPDIIGLSFSLRYGQVRFTGPYGVHIIAGMMLSLAFLLNHGLSTSHLWKKSFDWLYFLPFKKSFFLYLILGIGVLMPFSRGPVFGLIVGFVFMSMLRAGFYSVGGVIRLGVVVCLLFFGYLYYRKTVESYEFIGAGEVIASTYTREMVFNTLLPIIKQNIFWGRGINPDPASKLVTAVDNDFLYEVFTKGVLAFSIIIFVPIYQTYRLIKRGNLLRAIYPVDSNICYTFASILFFLVISLLNVVKLGTIEMFYYGFIGWVEGHLCSKEGTLDKSDYCKKLIGKKKKIINL